MLTIGHSTLSLQAFLRALQDNGVETLVDVRRFPGSRRHPQFSQAALFRSLEGIGIEAIWREGLGGRRKAQRDSKNTGWKNESFRGYADYMQTPEFEAEVDRLTRLPEIANTVVMCAEAVPWRCHRSLIADAVMARGLRVEDVLVKPDGESTRKPHRLTPFAQVSDERVWYPREPVLFV
ncbi:MAG TPA: DUF488 domain-containing protein [Edaphobacter sp.]|nr:DUF488 domain-containing protein [Edaphobacter sp.]